MAVNLDERVFETQSRMGWSDETLMGLIADFIGEKKLSDDLVEFLDKKANEEDEECKE